MNKNTDSTFLINAEFDALLVKPIYLVKDSVMYDQSVFKEPIKFSTIIGRDDVFRSELRFIDPVFNTRLKAFIYLKKDQNLEFFIYYETTERLVRGELKTIFPMSRKIMIRVKK